MNHTALTDLQQRLTAVEGSVGKVQQDVGGLGLPSNLKVAVATKAGAILDIKGKGKLYACGVNTAGEMLNAYLSISIDGVSKQVSYYVNGSVYGGYISIPCLLSLSSSSRSTAHTAFGAMFASYQNYFCFTSGNIPDNFGNVVYITHSPIPFSSLKANAGNLSNPTYALFAYTLDE